MPALVLVNDESATLKDTFHWILRQLLTVRLYHRDWPLVLAHGLFSGSCLFAVLIAIVWLYSTGETKLGSILLAALLLFELGNTGLMAAIQSANMRVVYRRISTTRSINSVGAGLPAILVTQLIYPFAVFTAATLKRVTWRGIAYAIGPGNQVTMLAYRPYHGETDVQPNVNPSDRSIG